MKDSNKFNKCLILANGKPPAKRVISYFVSKGYSYIICADGGANTSYKMNVIPDIIIGDLDSIEQKVFDHYSGNVKIIRQKRQNDTDVEKALKYAVLKGCKEAVLCGVTGDRLDHTFCNIGVLLKFSSELKIYLYHQESIAYIIEGNNKITCLTGETISVYGIDNKTRFLSTGLKYPLEKVSLPFGIKESTSNVAVKSQIEINTFNGKGIIIRDFNTIVKHDLLFNS